MRKSCGLLLANRQKVCMIRLCGPTPHQINGEIVDWLASHSRKFQTTQQVENDNALLELAAAISRFRLYYWPVILCLFFSLFSFSFLAL